MLTIKEQLKKKVVKSGNGGAVWVPKAWLGEEVVVILPEKPRLDVRERIIHQLEPHLKDIVSVSLYGSYARGEQTQGSDVDVLVITQEKKHLHIQGLDILSISLHQLQKAIVKYPVLYYHIIQEAQPLVNSPVLQELKKTKVTYKNFKNYLHETKEHLHSNKELVELDKLDGDMLRSTSVAYSSLLRLKGFYIIDCFVKKKVFTSAGFKQWLITHGLEKREFDSAYAIYCGVRDGIAQKTRISIATAEKMLNLL